MFSLFEKTSATCSRIITEQYSTSFSMGIKTLAPELREPIYGIYAMVRYADEIVDTFHDFDKSYLLSKFRNDTFEAISSGISLNPVLHTFQKTVHRYSIPLPLIEAFFHSMEMDLHQTAHGQQSYEEYIYGSAEVVGLMCLKVFTNGDEKLYDQLEQPARALGAAFQKVNFLRDMKSDYDERGRVYFPGIDFTQFETTAKRQIEEEIEKDFDTAMTGIRQLPPQARGGVMLAYRYYAKLFDKIKKVPAAQIRQVRIRVPDGEKILILAATLMHQRLFAVSPGV